MPVHLSPVPSSDAAAEPTDHLLGLAHLLADDALAPSLCGVVADERELELHVQPLDGPDPVLGLFGFAAPASWDALGVAVTGRGRRLTGTREPSPGPEDEAQVVVGIVLDRRGVLRSVLRRDRQPPVVVEDHECSEPRGLLVDACRRALDLPTPPPDRPTSALLTAIWLDLVVAAAAADPARPPTRNELARLHPALQVRGGRRGATQPARLVLPRALDDLGQLTWDRLRANLADDAEAERRFDLPAGSAGWMDEGMLSRWLLTRMPDAAELRAAVGELLPTRTAEWVADMAVAADRGPEPARV